MADPSVSVVIPTRRRAHLLRRALRALSRQTFPADQFEVVVVDDGGDVGLEELVRNASPQLGTSVVRTGQRGPAAARNAGVARARGQLLIFVDDDMIPARGFIAAHVHCHALHPRSVVVGSVRSVVVGPSTRQVRDNLKRRTAMRHRPLGPADLLTGNCSLSRALFDELGGFTTALRRHEDYELGWRVATAGLPLIYCGTARAIELHTRGVDLFLENAFLSGQAAARITRANPAAGHHFQLARYFQGPVLTRVARAAVWYTVQLPALGLILQRCVRSRSLGSLGLKVPALGRALGATNYWCGVAEEFKTPHQLMRTVLPGGNDKV